MGIKIGILNPGGLELCTQKALAVLIDAFAQQNIKVQPCLYTEQLPKADLLIGSYEKSQRLRDLVAANEIPLPLTPEAILIQELTINDHTALWACGYDTRGLLYALYELAARINAQSVPALYTPAREEPTFKRRNVLHRLPLSVLKRGWTIAPDYWRSYFQMLIKNRFNSFTLALVPTGQELVFPYFFSVPEHAEVGPFHISEEQRLLNLQTLKTLGELAVESGLDFSLGFGHFYGGQSPLPFRGLGLNEENICSYHYLALKQLLFSCPEISGLEFQFPAAPLEPEFCQQAIIQAVLDHGNQISLSFSANHISAEIAVLLATAGISSYLMNADWGAKLRLAYPQDEGETVVALGQEGDTNVPGYVLPIPAACPWGDPDYLQQLLPTLKKAGYDRLQLITPAPNADVTLPLDGAGEEPLPHWDYARHWYQFHLCGRLAYYPGTNGAVLIRDFHRRFGEKGNDLAALYQLVGKVLPLYNTIHEEDLVPGPEFNTGGLLAFYLRTPSADPVLFADCGEYVRATLDRTPLSKITPPLVAAELNRLGKEIRAKVHTLREVTLNSDQVLRREWEQTLLWAELIGCFALYHGAKLQAASELAFFTATKDLNCLENALAFLKEARSCWERLPSTVRQPEQRLLLMEDEKRIQALLAEYRRRGLFIIGFDFGGLPVSSPSDQTNRSLFPDYHVEEGFVFVHPQTAYNPDVGYGWLDTKGLEATPAPAVRLGEHDLQIMTAQTNSPFPYENQLLNKLVWSRTSASFQIDLSPGRYQVHLTFCDRSPEARRHGPMQISLNGQVIATDLVISPGKRVDLRETVDVPEGQLAVTFSCPPDQDWFISALTIHPVAPIITHKPVTTWERGKPLAIRTTVTGVKPIGQVILNYQTENERGYHMVIMTPVSADQFMATIPAAYLEQGDLINYYITAMDSGGREVSLGSYETPFQVNVRKTATYTPIFFHFPPAPEEMKEAVTFKCTVRPAAEVERVILYYKNAENKVNQVTLAREDAENEYGITISRPELLPDQIIKYRFVVHFNDGELALFPNPLTAVPYFELKTGAD